LFLVARYRKRHVFPFYFCFFLQPFFLP
jgi:hypothetical protein